MLALCVSGSRGLGELKGGAEARLARALVWWSVVEARGQRGGLTVLFPASPSSTSMIVVDIGSGNVGEGEPKYTMRLGVMPGGPVCLA